MVNSMDCIQTFHCEKSKLFAGGLGWSTTSDSLREYFQQYGRILNCVIMFNPKTMKPRGFGFVTFESQEVADQVLQKKHVIDAKEIDVKPCTAKVVNRMVRKQQDALNSRKIFVGGIPTSATEVQLFSVFEEHFGEVEEVVIMCHPEQPGNLTPLAPKSRSRGFGFITFSSEQTAQTAVQQRYFTHLGKQMEIKAAEPKNPCDLIRAVERHNMEPMTVNSREPIPCYVNTGAGQQASVPLFPAQTPQYACFPYYQYDTSQLFNSSLSISPASTMSVSPTPSIPNSPMAPPLVGTTYTHPSLYMMNMVPNFVQYI